MCFIGDMGDGSDYQRKVAQDLKKENCHHVFVVGDVIYSNGIESVDDPQLKEKFLDIYAPVAASGHRPQFSVVLGNHDFRGNEDAWLEIPKKHPWVFFPHFFYLQKMNGICYAGVDTNFYTSALMPTAFSQSKWLENLQGEMKDCQYKVLFSHHPYLSQEKHRPAKGWLKKVYEKYIVGKFDMVVSGHDHILADLGKHKGTHFFISGAGGRHHGGVVGYLVLELEFRNKNLRYSKPRLHYVK